MSEILVHLFDPELRITKAVFDAAVVGHIEHDGEIKRLSRIDRTNGFAVLTFTAEP